MKLTGEAFQRLRWRCVRRGLLELDLLLEKFLDEEYPRLTDEQAVTFHQMTLLEDPELWDLVTKRTACDNPAWNELLDMLRKG